MEVENELENFTYISRESSRRFPAHLFYFRTLIPIAIVLVSISGAIGFVGALEYEEGFALLVLVWTFIGAFSLTALYVLPVPGGPHNSILCDIGIKSLISCQQ